MKGRDKAVFTIFVLLNIFLSLKLLQEAVLIVNTNYLVLILLMLLGVCMHSFYHYVLKKIYLKITFSSLLIIIGALIFRFNTEKILEVIYNTYVKNALLLNELILKSEYTEFKLYIPFLIIVIPIVTAIIISLCLKWFNFILLLQLAVNIVLWYGNSTTTVKKYLLIYIFLTVLTYLFISYLKKKKESIKKGIEFNVELKKIIAYTLVISLFFTGLVAVFPKDFEGKGTSKFLKDYFNNKYAKERKVKKMISGKDNYSLGMSGYSEEDSKLGGSIVISRKPVMKVKTPNLMYLKGNTKDSYDGSMWTKSKHEYIKIKQTDHKRDIDYKDFTQLYVKKDFELEIQYEKNFKTTSIFSPNLPSDISIGDDVYYDKFTYDILSVENKSSAYNISGIVLQDTYGRNIPADIDELEEKKIKPKKFMVYNLKSIDKATNDEYFDLKKKEEISGYEVDRVRFAKKYDDYLQIPTNISERTYDLVESIIGDSETSYEKVRKIKEYLSKNYPYSTEVTEVPDEREFLDYFLFDEKQGYCTYFATAMTVMCRIAGVPARFAEGFKMSDNRVGYGRYLVTNEDAHAWCEVLAYPEDGIWVIADPSPTPAEIRRKENEIKEDTEEENDFIVNRNKQKDRLLREQFMGEDFTKIDEKNEFDYKIIFIMIIFVWIMYCIIKHIKDKKKLLYGDSVIPIYKLYIKFMNNMGIKRKESEGDYELLEKIVDNELKEKFKDIIEATYEEFYGGVKETHKDRKEKYEYIKKITKIRLGTFKYLLLRIRNFILGQ